MKRSNGSIWVLIFVLFAVLVSVLTAVTVSAKGKPDLSARAAALYEPSSEKFLYSENADARLPMASTTKIMTALVTAERLSPEDKVIIPREAVGTEGSSAYFEEGEELRVRDLLYALLLRSANDAAVALAVHTSGSIDGFSLLMNEKAESLQLSNTSFANPHGLHSEDHYTSAHDLARITAAALENPLIKEIVATTRATVTSSTATHTFLNHNKLLHIYEDCVGVKTGFTKNAGRCLVGAAERDGVLLISVTLNAPNDWNDHRMLLDLGFELAESRLLAAAGDFEYSLPTLNSDRERVTVSLKDDVRAVLLKSDGNVRCDVCLPRYLSAPLTEGERVGEVIFTLDGKVIAHGELCVRENTALAKKRTFIDKIKDFFKK